MSLTYFEFVRSGDADLFTVVCLPEKKGTFPTVIYRSPYVPTENEMSPEAVCDQLSVAFDAWTKAGYATVFQHCRGCGHSSGDCIPYINEREDGLCLHDWVRRQPFYNGELYLNGGSYCASVHFVTAPFAPDIKAAVFEVQDQNRYNCNYRNGFYKMGLHGGWYVGMYKKKGDLQKSFTPECYHILPLSDFSKTVLTEPAADFDAILEHPDPTDDFWKTRYGGGETIGAVDRADIPLLFVTGFYDIYTGGIFDMWRGLDPSTKQQSALLVHPYAHSGDPADQPVHFENGALAEAFGNYALRFIQSVRTGCEMPFETGKVTYFTLFENRWRTDSFEEPQDRLRIALGTGERTYRYDPSDPASFNGGLSANFGGTAFQDPPNRRQDIITVYSEPMDTDVTVKGKMTASLNVHSDCEDTCFYMRISLCTDAGDLGLRDDIQSIGNVCPDYRTNDTVTIGFSFDEHAFLIRKGERLRIDISSSAFPHYVRHTNLKGAFAHQTTAVVAHNTVILDGSYIDLGVCQPHPSHA